MAEGSERKVSRRKFIGSVAAGVAVAGVIAGVGGYYAGQAAAPAPGAPTTVTRTTTVTGPATTSTTTVTAPPTTVTQTATSPPTTVTQTLTQTVTAAPKPLEKLKFKIGENKLIDEAPLYMALEKGLFEAEGLDPEVEFVRGGGPGVEAIQTGVIDVMLNGPAAVMKFIDSKGIYHKLVTAPKVAGTYRGRTSNLNGGVALVVKKGAGIKRLVDLKGKKIAVISLGSVVHMCTSLLLKRVGLDPTKDVEWKEIAFPKMPPALATGEVDVISTVDPYIAFSVKEGFGEVLVDPPVLPFAQIQVASMGSPFVGAVYWTSEETLKKKPEAIRRFIRGMAAGVRWLYADMDDTYTILSNRLKMDREIIVNVFPYQFWPHHPEGLTDARDVDILFGSQIKGYLELGFLTKPLEPEKLKLTFPS